MNFSWVSLQMIASTFLFSYWEKRFDQKSYHQKSKSRQISHQMLLDNTQSIVETNHDLFEQINQLICLSRVRWRVQFNTCVDLCFEEYHLFVDFFSFFLFSFNFVIHLLFCLVCFFCLTWTLHDWSIWLQNIHLLMITSFDKRIFFLNSWIIIQIFQRLSSYFQQVISFCET
jgi:hypothetical protein